jgi:hypothetical protein
MPGWVKNNTDGALKQAWVWKYNKGPKPKTDDVSFLTIGPNAACPDPVVPLTSNRAKLTGALDSLRAYAASGTNIGEGLAWAWRLVSPGEPFTEGAPYGPTNKKYIVLMTDGFNEVVPQSVSWNKSDYTSVGYAAKARLGTTDLPSMTKVLDKRMAEVCTNIKKAFRYSRCCTIPWVAMRVQTWRTCSATARPHRRLTPTRLRHKPIWSAHSS